MITFATQTITKKVYADQASRLNLCCMILWVFAIVFPVLYLVSIGNLSWPTTSYTTITPTLTYKNYQITYTNNSNGISQYYTNLDGRASSGDTPPNIIGGVSSNSQLPITIGLRDSSITSISGIIYLDVVISGSVSNQFVGIVPFYAYTEDGSSFINTLTVSHSIKVRTTSPLEHNYQMSMTQNTPFFSYQSTMIQNIATLSTNSLGLILENSKISKTSTSSAVYPSISIELSISKQKILVSSSLLSQMREFFRQWIYVFIPISWLVMFFIKKLVEIRIYPSRTGYAEEKQKIL